MSPTPWSLLSIVLTLIRHCRLSICSNFGWVWQIPIHAGLSPLLTSWCANTDPYLLFSFLLSLTSQCHNSCSKLNNATNAKIRATHTTYHTSPQSRTQGGNWLQNQAHKKSSPKTYFFKIVFLTWGRGVFPVKLINFFLFLNRIFT